jgi:deoxyribonuclease V
LACQSFIVKRLLIKANQDSMNEIPRTWLYPDNLTQAAQIQRELAERVQLEDHLNEIRRIGGTDASNLPSDPEKRMTAVCVSLSYPDLCLQEYTYAQSDAPLPYVPGFLGFREAPALVEAFGQLEQAPDLLLVDGHGISHPRRLGIASHLGVLLDCPSIGVAKSILVGKPSQEPGSEVGDATPLLWRGTQIGWVLRSRRNTMPIYISPGHRVSMQGALDWVIRCLGKTKLPEPTRLAHLTANQVRKGLSSQQAHPPLPSPLFATMSKSQESTS